MIYSRKLLILWGLFVAFGIFSCEQTPFEEEQGENIARVGNEYLTAEQAKKEIPSFLYKQDSVSALEQYREQWIQRKLVLREANKLNLRQQQEIQEKLQRAQEEILREAIRIHVISSQVDSTVTDKEAKAYYEANKEHFALGEVFVQYRHLRTEDVEIARTAKQELQAGTPWEEVADKYDMEPLAAINRAQRYQPISTALGEIEIMNRYLQSIDINEVSPIQRVNGIYHFVQLTDKRKESDSADMEWIINKVKNWILLDKRQRKFNSYLKNLYLKAESDNEIEVYNVLPTESNSQNSTADTLESNSTDE